MMDFTKEIVVFMSLLSMSTVVSQAAQVVYHIKEENQGTTLVGNAFVDSQLRSKLKNTNNLHFEFVSPTAQTSFFRIEGWSGAIHTARVVDREVLCVDNTCPVNLDVAVQLVTGASLDLISIIRVQVFVDDINDNAPTFPFPSVSLDILESTPVDTTFPISAATDLDTAKNNSQISYELQPAAGFGKFGMSVIKNWDGSTDIGIIVKETLDREATDFYQVQIIAEDGGSPSLTGTLSVNIRVMDSNDHSPVFAKPLWNVTVWENVTIGTEILRLSTNDRDIGKNGEVTYKFSSRSASKVGSIFSIEETTGAVTVIGAVDFESASLYQLIIEATDNGIPSRSSKSAVIIHVLDVNDNPPDITFNLLAGGDHALISEYAKPGSFVAHVSVSDSDILAENKDINCWIRDALFDLKKLSSQEFKVLLQGEVDREKKGEYRVDVSCSDFGTPPLEATAPLRVVVKDENDHSPKFMRKQYSRTITENFPIGKTIVVVSAEDKDIGENGKVQYSFGQNGPRNLTINTTTGVIVATGFLDREQTPVIKVPVFAYDNGTHQHTATASLTLTLEDVNDEAPKFNQEAYSFLVKENIPAGTSIGTMQADDPDLGIGGQVYYSLLQSSPGKFNISRSGGVITTNQEFDRESKSQYKIVAIATDRGSPAISSQVSIVINISDVNDHFPVFTYPNDKNNTVEILHSAEVDRVITNVKAYDLDDGKNSQLSYFIQTGNSKRLLKMNRKTGDLKIAQRIPSYLAGEYELMIGVKDNGNPSKSSWKTLNLIINIDNTTALEVLEEPHQGNVIIVVSVISATIILSIAIIIGIIVVRRQDARKHIYRAKVEERKIIRRKGSIKSHSDQSNTSSTSSDSGRKDVSLTLTDDSQAPLNASTFTQVTSFSTFKGQMLSYISSIDQKTLECPQACSSWITTNTISPEQKQECVGDKRADIQKLAYEHAPPVSHSDRAYLQIIHEETETKSMLKSLNDTLSDVSSETMVTSDSGRGGSEEDVHLKSTDPESHHQHGSETGRPLSSFGNYHPRRSYHDTYRDSYGRFPPRPQSACPYSPKRSNNVNFEKNINVSDASITDNTTVRTNDRPPPRPLRFNYHNTPSQQIVDVPSVVASHLPKTQDTVRTQPMGFLSRLHMKSPSAQMCSPSLAGRSGYYNGDTFRSGDSTCRTQMYDATTASEQAGTAYSLGDIDTLSECPTDIKDDDATTTSGSYTINPDELCNEIDELFFKDIIV